MIAPCIAATLYKLPSLFLAREPTDELVTDAVDLLIIDEAGQVLPNIAGASLAVARRAIVVGDTFQLSPIATLPRYVDWANWNGVGESMEGLTPENLETAGITASGGLLMRMAQHGCRHRQHARFPRGFWLREHRRCVAPIIEYCNELIYGGLLDPLRLEPSKGIYPWPHMGLVHVDGTSITNGSRTNPAEVATVVEWVENNWQAVFDWYRFKAKQHSPLFTPIDDDSIRESRKLIAVVTPYRQQADCIARKLPKHLSEVVTVGTVDVLQGSERRMVLFSSVCTPGDSTRFIEELPNRLNVAVSRAEDSFLVFGHAEIFDPAKAGALGMLGQRLQRFRC
jgi:superfamily I DNA and/or RNA helicase